MSYLTLRLGAIRLMRVFGNISNHNTLTIILSPFVSIFIVKFVLIQLFCFGDSRSLFQAITPLWGKYMPIFWHFSGWWWGHLPLAGKNML